MMEIAKAYIASPDGKTALYDFLEEQIKPSRTSEKRAALNAKPERVVNYGNALDSPTRQGIPALAYITEKGIA